MTPSTRPKIGLVGFAQHPWRSVEATRHFYARALEEDSETVVLGGDGGFPDIDAILNFAGNRGWSESLPDRPVLFAIHGGCVLNREFIRARGNHLRTSDTLIVNSSADVSILSELFGERKPAFHLQRLPVREEIQSDLPKAECRTILSIAVGTPVVGFVARVLPQKGLHYAIRLTAEAQQIVGKAIHLVIVGDYWEDYPVLKFSDVDYADYCRDLLDRCGFGGRVTWLPGNLDDMALSICYGAMDVVLHPTVSVDENYGYVPLEAMKAGRPVVATAYGGLKDTVTDGETGFLMPTWTTASGVRFDDDVGSRALADLLRDTELRSRMGAAGMRSVDRDYSFKACAGSLRAAIHDAIARHAEGASPCDPVPAPRALGASGLLPRLRHGWEHFEPSVRHYVTLGNVAVGPHTPVRLAAPMRRVDATTGSLDDPAWPATYHLDRVELDTLAGIERPKRVAELAALSMPRIQHLVEAGLLTVCTSRAKS